MQTAENRTRYLGSFAVAPLAGAWIEIAIKSTKSENGLVAPLAGAWIEIISSADENFPFRVAPLAGAWIEIWCYRDRQLDVSASLPSRERGLKSVPHPPHREAARVAPLAGAWIEIIYI